MANLGDLVVRITGDNSDLNNSIDDTRQKMQNFGSSMTRVGRNLTAFVTAPLVGIGIAAVKSAADLEMMEAAFETMLGSAEAAVDMMKDLEDFAARTPFQLQDLAAGTKTLLAFGIAAEDVLPTMSMLGDIAGGDSQRLKQLALVFGQVNSAGRLMGQDLLQLINVGFNPLQTISKQTGETMAELKDRMAAGAISAEEVAGAFRAATSEGGLFFGGMERASQTLSGVTSTLKDNVAALGRSFADILLPFLKDAATWSTELVQRWTAMDTQTKKTILTIAGLAASLGPLALAIGVVSKAMLAFSAPPTGALVLAAFAVVALTTAIIELIRRNREYERLVYDTVNAVSALNQEELEGARNRLEELRSGAADRLAAAIERRAEAADRLREAEATQNANTAVGARIIAEAQRAHEAAAGVVERHAQTHGDLQNAIVDVDRKLVQNQIQLQAEQEAFDDTTASAEELTAGLADLAGTIEDPVLPAVQNLNDALREGTTGAMVGVLNVIARIRAAKQQLYQEALIDQALFDEETLNNNARTTANIVAQMQALRDEQIALKTEVATTSIDLSWKASAAQIEAYKEILAAAEKAAEEEVAYRRWLVDTSIGMASSLADALVSFSNSVADNENVNSDKALQLQIRAARFKKAVGIFSAGIDTARAIIGFLADPGGIAGALLSIGAGIVGAASIAAIAASPLPSASGGGGVPSTPPTLSGIDTGGFSATDVGGFGFTTDRPDSAEDVVGGAISGFDRAPISAAGDAPIYIQVDLDSKPILETVTKASQDRRILIDARSVV